MATKAATEQQPETLTVSQAAAKLGVSPDKVMGWINKGYLKAFIDPDFRTTESRPGPRTVRIWIKEWERFAAACTTNGPAPAATEPESDKRRPVPGAAGTDGVSRRRKRAGLA